MDPEVWQVLKSLIATSPLAAVLLVCAWHLWRRLREVEDAKDKVYADQVDMLRTFLISKDDEEAPK